MGQIQPTRIQRLDNHRSTLMRDRETYLYRLTKPCSQEVRQNLLSQLSSNASEIIDINREISCITKGRFRSTFCICTT